MMGGRGRQGAHGSGDCGGRRGRCILFFLVNCSAILLRLLRQHILLLLFVVTRTCPHAVQIVGFGLLFCLLCLGLRLFVRSNGMLLRRRSRSSSSGHTRRRPRATMRKASSWRRGDRSRSCRCRCSGLRG